MTRGEKVFVVVMCGLIGACIVALYWLKVVR